MPTFLATYFIGHMHCAFGLGLIVFLHRFIYSRFSMIRFHFDSSIVSIALFTLFGMICVRACTMYTVERAIEFVQGNDHRSHVIKTFAVSHNQTQSCFNVLCRAHNNLFVREYIIMNFVALNSNLSFERKAVTNIISNSRRWHRFIAARASLN